MLEPMHVAALVDSATGGGITPKAMRHDFGPTAPSPGFRACKPEDADYLGNMLMHTMRRSVRHVHHDTVDQEITAAPESEPAYSHATARQPLHEHLPLSEIETANALSCYEYQACEAPDWKKSEAERFCRYLRKHLLDRLAQDNDLWIVTPDLLHAART